MLKLNLFSQKKKKGEYEQVWGSCMSWPDICTAYYSTGIPNISFYLKIASSARCCFWLFSLRCFKWMMGSESVQNSIKAKIPEGGPSEEWRDNTSMGFFGEAIDHKEGKQAITLLRACEGYKLTQLASVAVISRVSKGDAPIGFRTPSLAYGEDFITTIEGSQFEDLPVTKYKPVSLGCCYGCFPCVSCCCCC